MRKNSGSALTSVIVVFMLVTLIGAPLLTMVVYNYQFREYDSAIKEAEYKNEVAMDIIATIIKREVITAITSAKITTTQDVKKLTDGLINSYNNIYDDAYDEVLNSEFAKYDEKGQLTNKQEVDDEVRSKISDKLGDNANLLDMSNLTGVKINEQKLQEYCNKIFQAYYHEKLLNTDEGIFTAIYNKNVDKNEYKSVADKFKYGDEGFSYDTNTGKAIATTLKVVSKYRDYSSPNNDFTVYKKGEGNPTDLFDSEGKFYLGIETQYKRKSSAPITSLAATYVIGTPDFNVISSLEQQSVALSNPTLDYGLVVGETLNIKGNLNIDGNMIARANGIRKKIGTDAENKEKIFDDGIVLLDNSSLNSIKIGTNTPSDGRIVTVGDIIMKDNTSLSTGTNPIFYRNLYLGGKEEVKNVNEINVKFNGDVLAKDDLEINSNGKITIEQTAGSYYGFNDKNDDGPDSSSAIVINTSANSLNKINITLNNLYLAGRAFIDGVTSAERDNGKITDENGTKIKPLYYKTGESISVKGNYIAYQSPLKDKYALDKVKFSPYFMKGTKEGIDTNLVVNLVDKFIDVENTYESFDKQNKWEYFKEYALANPTLIKKPNTIRFKEKYIEGAGIKNGNVIDRVNDSKAQAINLSKEVRFDEFTKYMGYMPKDQENLKEGLENWIKFPAEEKIEKNGDLFVYISKNTSRNTSQNPSIKFSSKDNDILEGDAKVIHVPSDGSEKNVNGIIIHKGNLTIKNEENFNFNGVIIVTGNLTIEGKLNIVTDKEKISEIIINNYLGKGISGSQNSSKIEVGDLFNSFEYDGSGTTYVIITVADQSNMIDINSLIGIKDWKKRRFVGI